MRTKKTELDLAYRRPTHLCDSTVAIPTSLSGPRFVALRREVGRCERISSALHQGRAAGYRSTPKILGRPKTIMMIRPMGGGVSCASPPHSLCIHYMNAMLQAKRAPPTKTKDRPKTTKKEETQKEHRRGVGCESGT